MPSKRLLERFRLLAEIIRSDQLTHDQVLKLMASDPEFARWYRKQYGLKKG